LKWRALFGYAVEKVGKFLRSDFRRFTPDPLQAIHFARCLRAACRGMGGNVVKITIEHPGACRDLGDLVDTRVVSIEVV